MATHKWKVPKRLFAIAVLIAVAILATGCFPDNPQSTFDARGTVARSQLTLFLIIFWMAVFVFVAVVGAILYTTIRFRRRADQQFPKQVHGNTKLEIAWTIAPALVLLVIAIPTIDTIFDTANTPDRSEVLQLQVSAHQWWWEFEYPQLGLVTANELHVPPEPWVIDVALESGDVIHSFWIPKLVGKTDIVPNNTNTLWFSADPPEDGQPATFFGQCAEFCGTAHAQMRFRVIVEPSKEAFDAWVARQLSPAVAPTEDLATQGRRVFGLKGCGVCHSVVVPEPEGIQETRMDVFLATGKERYPAPNLTHFGSRATFAGGIINNTDDNLKRWLRDPDEVKPGNRMAQLAGAYQDPNLALMEEDISALVAYLRSLR